MFNAVADEFTLQILIGERLAAMLWHMDTLYYAVIVTYVLWRVWRHHKGEPMCHHKNCTHVSVKVEKKVVEAK